MAWIFEVRAQNGDRVLSFGARRTSGEAEELLAQTQERVAAVGGRNDRYWIEQIDTTGAFETPTLPTPRQRFAARVEQTAAKGAWETVRVEVLDGDRVVATYDRNHAMLQTFEPFRQGERHYALISPDYTATSVMDLDTGQIVAAEESRPDGFCPVGFYVPDWWDIHDGTKLPGQLNWTEDDEWPSGGDFGFVWGCVWGDDSSWKVQYLDLSGVQHGLLRRQERFGYLRLASRPDSPATDFIRCSSHKGQREVDFDVTQTHDLVTGVRTNLDPWGED